MRVSAAFSLLSLLVSLSTIVVKSDLLRGDGGRKKNELRPDEQLPSERRRDVEGGRRKLVETNPTSLPSSAPSTIIQPSTNPTSQPSSSTTSIRPSVSPTSSPSQPSSSPTTQILPSELGFLSVGVGYCTDDDGNFLDYCEAPIMELSECLEMANNVGGDTLLGVEYNLRGVGSNRKCIFLYEDNSVSSCPSSFDGPFPTMDSHMTSATEITKADGDNISWECYKKM